MITRIELKNFMSHQHTVIEPARGLTVIAGPNNCGKSAIVTALQILCYNDESTFVTRHGEKECSIKVFTDDGHEIEWIRTKSKSTKYIIDGQQHDRLGRGGTPDDLHKFLKIQKVSCDNTEFDVHFGSQQSPVFLLNDSPRAAAQFFASSSDAINLIGMQTRHKQRVRDRKQEKRRIVFDLKQVDEKLGQLELVPDITKQLAELEVVYQALKCQEEEIAALQNLVGAINEKTDQLQLLDLQTKAMKGMSPPPELAATDPLSQHLIRTGKNTREFEAMSVLLGPLSELHIAPELQGSEELETVCRGIQAAAQAFGEANARAKALLALNPIPEQYDTGPLSGAIVALNESRCRFAHADQQLGACQQLQEVPDLPESKGLAELLGELTKQARKCDKLEERIEKSDVDLGEVLQTLERWVDANPSCPTCGSEMSTDQILHEGHRHE